MPKKLTEGVPWWLGEQADCPFCGCKIELIATDRPLLTPVTGQTEDGELVAAVRIGCPQCWGPITVPRPAGLPRRLLNPEPEGSPNEDLERLWGTDERE